MLIGYVDEARRAVVLRATGPGPGVERSATLFSRDVPFIQAELERAVAELGERGLYLGEWHSHLEAEPSPSPTDIGSLFGIASAPNYLTRCPVMIVVGYDPVMPTYQGVVSEEGLLQLIEYIKSLQSRSQTPVVRPPVGPSPGETTPATGEGR